MPGVAVNPAVALFSLLQEIKGKDANWSNNPNYVQFDKNVQSQRTAFDKLKQKLRERLRDEHSNRPEPIAEVKHKLAILESKKDLLSRRMVEAGKNQTDRKSKVVELEFARGELSREEKVFELVAARKLALQTELRAPARVQLRQGAIVSAEPNSKPPYGWLAVACSVALLAPFAVTMVFRRPTRDLEQSNGPT